MLLWARENGRPCPDLNMMFGLAAMSGNVEMATWFREQGCPLHHGLCTMAAEYGQLETLMWLREHGCPVELDECRDFATRCWHSEVVEWLGQFTNETWQHHTAD